MAKKYYAVRVGKTPGIYTDWETCKNQIEGFPKAVYKGFKTLGEAEDWFKGENKEKSFENNKSMQACSSKTKTDNLSPKERPTPEQGCAIAYVDGSFFEGGEAFSYGIVLFIGTEEIHMAKSFKNKELLEMRNVAGEIMGAAQAMKTASERGCRKITVYHDYEGIAKWCTGEWKTNRVWTKKYKKFYDEISEKIEVEFVKVKAHTTDKYNNLADALAKGALK